MRILLAENERESRASLADFLTEIGHDVVACPDGRSALDAFCSQEFQLVLTELKMPKMSGMELLKHIRSADGRMVDVVVFTGYGERHAAREALRLGAVDCLHKPLSIEELVSVIERLEQRGGKRLRRGRKGESGDQETCVIDVGEEKIIVCSQAMREVLWQAEKLHQDPLIPVLIVGETGTGKEVIARYLHCGEEGDSSRPFVAVNCAALAPTLFEAELFGYEPGAFTGGLAKGQKGKVDLAAGGTLFLDEITELPVDLQAKLLRLIQEREFYRVGGLKRIKTDARIVCATNTDILKRVEEGAFREDLYYRLSVGEIHLPPLRERREEIIPLARSFLEGFAQLKGKRFQGISPEAAELLVAYDWPGNVRELKNLIEWAVLMHDDEELKPCHIEARMRKGEKASQLSRERLPAGDRLPQFSASQWRFATEGVYRQYRPESPGKAPGQCCQDRGILGDLAQVFLREVQTSPEREMRQVRGSVHFLPKGAQKRTPGILVDC